MTVFTENVQHLILTRDQLSLLDEALKEYKAKNMIDIEIKKQVTNRIALAQHRFTEEEQGH